MVKCVCGYDGYEAEVEDHIDYMSKYSPDQHYLAQQPLGGQAASVVTPSQMPTTLYTTGDVARLFGYSERVANNWVRRYEEAPKPDFVTQKGQMMWLSLEPWKAWYTEKWGKGKNTFPLAKRANAVVE